VIDPNATGAQTKLGTQKSLMMMPGERYEIIVDFAAVPAGANLILAKHGRPRSRESEGQPGRRIMQFRVSGTVPAGGDQSYDPALHCSSARRPIVRLPGTRAAAYPAHSRDLPSSRPAPGRTYT